MDIRGIKLYDLANSTYARIQFDNNITKEIKADLGTTVAQFIQLASELEFEEPEQYNPLAAYTNEQILSEAQSRGLV